MSETARKSAFGPDRVQLDLSRDEWQSLLYVLSCALGAFLRDRSPAARTCLRITDTINEGNPEWTPYHLQQVPE